LALLPLVLVAGCWKSETAGNGSAGAPTAAASALDAEAARAGDAFWNKLLTHCGNRIFSAGYITGWSADGPGVAVTPDRYGSVAEFDTVSWKAVREPLSQADRLNGLEWQGLTIVYAAAIREKFSLQDGFGLWRTPAEDIPEQPKGVFAVVLAKTQGQWTYNGRPLAAIEPVKVDCANPTVFPSASEIRPSNAPAAKEKDKGLLRRIGL
jgi:hypothetical protein